VLPWLITTTAGPALTAHMASATAGVVADPAILGGVTAGALACAVTLRRRRPAPERVRPSGVRSGPGHSSDWPTSPSGS
jgi:hypothetical protein